MSAPSVSARARLRDEPLVRFALVAALVFAAEHALSRRLDGATDASRRIEISPAFVEGLRARHAARAGSGGAPPGDEALVREHVREEALYREAILRGLDRNDLIVRRRLVQAMELVALAEVDVPEPDDATLDAFLAEHAGELAEPRRTTLEHVYFARRRGPAAADDARAALEAVGGGASAEGLGDAFLSGRRVGPATDARLDGTFGDGFAAAIVGLAPGVWSGPFEGALGFHVVRVEARTERRTRPLGEIRDAVRSAWIEAERARLSAVAIDAMVAGYVVVRTPEEE